MAVLLNVQAPRELNLQKTLLKPDNTRLQMATFPKTGRLSSMASENDRPQSPSARLEPQTCMSSDTRFSCSCSILGHAIMPLWGAYQGYSFLHASAIRSRPYPGGVSDGAALPQNLWTICQGHMSNNSLTSLVCFVTMLRLLLACMRIPGSAASCPSRPVKAHRQTGRHARKHVELSR